MGEGHNSAAEALSVIMKDRWGCRVDSLDTMELRGERFARAARWAYAFQLSALPWSYAIFYKWLSRSDLFANAMKRVIGPFFGRHLSKAIDSRQPDLLISTYPFGSAALDWLCSNRALRTPTVTYIPAFHVHPLWAYPRIDMHFVIYDSAAAHARLPGFEHSMRVGAPPVRDGFGKFDRGEAREALQLPAGEFIVLVTGGAWGLGDMSKGVEALLKLQPAVHVLAVCGKNATLENELVRLAPAYSGRLKVYGYVSTMPQLMAAANVVVTNGAGVTVLEALRTARPVIAFSPLAGHGTASTAEMVRRNLALEARDVPKLVEQVRRLRTSPGLAQSMEQAGQQWVAGRSLGRSVAEIEALYVERAGSAVAPERSQAHRPSDKAGPAKQCSGEDRLYTSSRTT
jgi:diacylglycerol O-acyltransferase / wax synthase